jgi:hypothetical protein
MVGQVREKGILSTNNNGKHLRNWLDRLEWVMSREEFTVIEFSRAAYGKPWNNAASVFLNILLERKWIECTEVPEYGRAGPGQMYKYRPAKSLRMMMLMFRNLRIKEEEEEKRVVQGIGQ